MYRYPDLGFFSVPICFYVVIVFMSSVHAFCCRHVGAMGMTLPLSLARRLALQVSIAKFV